MRQRKGYSRKERTNEIGKDLTSLRISQGLTQQDVAWRLHKSKSYICRLETSGTTRADRLYEFALACGTRPEYLLAKVHQLQFNLLSAITAPAQLPTDPLKDITEEERRELISYLAFLRLRRGATAR